MDTAERIVSEAQEELEKLDARIAQARSDKLGLNQNIADLIEQRKPLSRIVNAAKGRNGHGPDRPE
jgi:mRNA-degrading endonuclease RelE of RelBE toxin-antitoxin system